MNEYIASGIPRTREIAVIPPNNFPMQYKSRGSDGRMPMYSQTDLSLQHAFKLGGSKSLQLELNVDNLFNQGTATNYFQTLSASGQGILFDETEFYSGKVELRSARRGGGEGPSLPDGQRIPGAHLGALRHPVPVLG